MTSDYEAIHGAKATRGIANSLIHHSYLCDQFRPIVCSGDRLCDVKRHVRTGHTTDIDAALEKRTRVTLPPRIWS